jgi:AcrR family transcriptional regulator
MSPEQRREMIVRATIPLLIEHGSSVTTRRIAQAAGIGEGTIFRVFTDKDELLDACIAETMDPGTSLAEIRSIPLEQPLAARLTQAAEALRAHVDRIGTVMGALHATEGRSRAAGRPNAGPPDRQAGVNAATDAIADLFAPEEDALRLPPRQLALLFFGLLFTSSTQESPQDIGPVVDVFLHGALASTV